MKLISDWYIGGPRCGGNGLDAFVAVAGQLEKRTVEALQSSLAVMSL